MATKPTMRRLAALGGAVVLLVAAGCGGDDGTDGADGTRTEGNGGGQSEGAVVGAQATPAYVSEVVDASSGQAYRYEMTMAMDLEGESIDLGGPIATGEFDGERNSMHMDMGAMFEAMFGSMGGGEELPEGLAGDMSVDYVTDGQALYLRAPFFASMFGSVPGGDASELGDAGGMATAFAELGDRWGRVDIAALGDVSPGQATGSLTGSQAYDPQVFLDMIRETAEVEDLGTDEIDGEPVTGLAAEVDMEAMLEAQGLSTADLGGDAAALAGTTFPIEVWVGADDLIRRIHFSFDEESLAGAGGDTAGGEAAAEALGGVGMAVTMDFTDYGDESIEVEVPTGDDVVDITEDFTAGLESTGDLGGLTPGG
jgi:hypothetical protein